MINTAGVLERERGGGGVLLLPVDTFTFLFYLTSVNGGNHLMKQTPVNHSPVTLSTKTCHLGTSCSRWWISLLFRLSTSASSIQEGEETLTLKSETCWTDVLLLKNNIFVYSVYKCKFYSSRGRKQILLNGCYC